MYSTYRCAYTWSHKHKKYIGNKIFQMNYDENVIGTKGSESNSSNKVYRLVPLFIFDEYIKNYSRINIMIMI